MKKQLNFLIYCNSLEVTYTKKMKREMFLGTFNSTTVVVKFVEQYGTEVHKLLAAKGYAPKLYSGSVKATSNYTMAVMEYLKNAITLKEFCECHPDLIK